MFAIKDTLARSQSLSSDCTFTWQTTSSSLRRKDIWNAGINTISTAYAKIRWNWLPSKSHLHLFQQHHPSIIVNLTDTGWVETESSFDSTTSWIQIRYWLCCHAFFLNFKIFYNNSKYLQIWLWKSVTI